MRSTWSEEDLRVRAKGYTVDPLRVITFHERSAFDNFVQCPVCDDSEPGNAALHEVIVNGNDSAISISSHGDANAAAVTKGERCPGSHGRGSSVQIRFDGECGHSWLLSFDFHKGAVGVRAVAWIWAENEHMPAGVNKCGGLWRD